MRTIVLEGINASGKSTVAHAIENRLRDSGVRCLAADPAGFGRIGQAFRKLIVAPHAVSTPDFDAVLFAALRTEGILHILEIAKDHPDTVLILERWSLALLAYGEVDGARAELISQLRSVLDDLLEVDVTILLDISGLRAYERIEYDTDKNRFELKGAQYLDSVARTYRSYANSVLSVLTVDATGSLEYTLQKVWDVIELKWGDLNGLGFF